jgi:tRNA uridine 5-carboxymethylaminomethyl modification enzyme
MGLVDDARWDAFSHKRDAVSRETERLKSIWVSPKNLAASEAVRLLGKPLEHEHNLADLLRRPEVTYTSLMSLDGGKYQNAELLASPAKEGGAPVSRETAQAIVEQIEISAKYAGYIGRQQEEVLRAAHYENLKLPQDLDYNQVSALSIEVRQRLNRQRPETLGQASRMTGITPAAVSLLLVHLRRARYKGFGNDAAAPEATSDALAN